MGVEKLYESTDYIIVNKPYDMYINSDNENEKNTITYHIACPDSHLSSSSKPLFFVHRLDYATSGVLCIAKNKSAASNVGKLFEKRATKKYYLAILRGHVEFELADIEYSVGIDATTTNTCHRMSACKSASLVKLCLQPRTAKSRVLVLETGFYNNDPVSVVLLKPVTGRRHQLRVHCSAIGHTILGDYTYSGTVDSGPHRMFLHATRLVLPLQQQILDIQTHEPFFTDMKFTNSWKPGNSFYNYKSKEDFRIACDVVDMPLVVGTKYRTFKCSD